MVDQYTIKTKYCIPPNHTNWFKNPFPASYAFKEDNMANISPTMKVEIYVSPSIIENISLRASCGHVN